MKPTIVSLSIALAASAFWFPAQALDLKDRVRVEAESVGLHPGLDPGVYVCAARHLHIRATVQNLADVALGKIKVAGRAFDAADDLLGTATASTRQPQLLAGEKAPVDLEFLTVTDAMIDKVARHDLAVVEAPTL